jgi:putative hemolysin
VRVALVLDEYGGVEGLITPRDLIEGIVGNLPSAGAVTGPEAVQRADGTWLVDGNYTVDELSALLDLRELPARGRVGYETVAGLLLTLLDRIPERGEVVTWGGWTFEVVDMDGLRIDQVLVAPEEGAEEQAGTEAS